MDTIVLLTEVVSTANNSIAWNTQLFITLQQVFGARDAQSFLKKS